MPTFLNFRPFIEHTHPGTCLKYSGTLRQILWAERAGREWETREECLRQESLRQIKLS